MIISFIRYVEFSPRRLRLGDNTGYVPHPTCLYACRGV